MFIKDITIKELPEFFNSALYQGSRTIPITPERIMSQVHNPRAQADDIVLIVAYTDNGSLAGFIGMIPDNGSSAEGPYRFAWNSCWWIDPEHGKDIALKLFYKSIQVWQGCYMISDLTSHTRKIVDYSRLFYFSDPSTGIRLQLRSDFSGKLNRRYKFIYFPFKSVRLLDKVVNLFLHYRLNKWKRKNEEEGLKIEYLEYPDNDSLSFIKKHNQNELSRRSKSEFSWILTYPWLVSNKSISRSLEYPFSWECRHFEFLVAKIRFREIIVGIAILSNRDGCFKLPYAYVEPLQLNTFSLAICKILIDKRATGFFTFRNDLSMYFEKNAFPYFYKETIVRELAVSKTLAHKHPEKLILQDGDGDAVFT
jgi:hypothetical protein